MVDTDEGGRWQGKPEADLPGDGLHDQVLDKWSLAVLNELCERPCRFNELRRAIPAVTQKSLTATLRRLERNGVIEREIVSTRPVAVGYRITPLGKTLRHPIDVLLAWASKHMPAVEDARDAFDSNGHAETCERKEPGPPRRRT